MQVPFPAVAPPIPHQPGQVLSQAAQVPPRSDKQRKEFILSLRMQLAPMLFALDQRVQSKLYALIAYILANLPRMSAIPMNMMLRLVDHIAFEAGSDATKAHLVPLATGR